jgi:hypothetical protein
VKLTSNAAAAGIVDDQQTRVDALHPHAASFSVIAAIVDEGDRSVLRRDLRLERAIMKITRGRKEPIAFNLQLAASAGLDFDPAAGIAPNAGRLLRRKADFRCSEYHLHLELRSPSKKTGYWHHGPLDIRNGVLLLTYDIRKLIEALETVESKQTWPRVLH